eukprot:8734102-Lingulodinium_polyedra.AAC.1
MRNGMRVLLAWVLLWCCLRVARAQFRWCLGAALRAVWCAASELLGNCLDAAWALIGCYLVPIR